MDSHKYNLLVDQLASGELVVDNDPELAAEIDDLRDWCARINLRQNPRDLIHDLLGPDIERWGSL